MQAEFNQNAEKVVNTDELRRIQMELEWQQFTWKEKLFQVVSDFHRGWLTVKSGFTGAFEQMRTGKNSEPGFYYADTVNQSQHGTTYKDRSKFEAETAFFEKNGVSKAFQEKSARIAAEAFNQARDFSGLVKTGQLKRLDLV